jgi:hypothetical protein
VLATQEAPDVATTLGARLGCPSAADSRDGAGAVISAINISCGVSWYRGVLRVDGATKLFARMSHEDLADERSLPTRQSRLERVNYSSYSDFHNTMATPLCARQMPGNKD